MKPPYFPEPKDASPYRESQREPEEVAPPPPVVVVSRPEPQPELERAAPTTEKQIAPSKAVNAPLTREEASALLAVHRNRHKQHVRARVLLAPVAIALWQYGPQQGGALWVVYPLLVISSVMFAFEIKRLWRRTEL